MKLALEIQRQIHNPPNAQIHPVKLYPSVENSGYQLTGRRGLGRPPAGHRAPYDCNYREDSREIRGKHCGTISRRLPCIVDGNKGVIACSGMLVAGRLDETRHLPIHCLPSLKIRQYKLSLRKCKQGNIRNSRSAKNQVGEPGRQIQVQASSCDYQYYVKVYKLSKTENMPEKTYKLHMKSAFPSRSTMRVIRWFDPYTICEKRCTYRRKPIDGYQRPKVQEELLRCCASCRPELWQWRIRVSSSTINQTVRTLLVNAPLTCKLQDSNFRSASTPSTFLILSLLRYVSIQPICS